MSVFFALLASLLAGSAVIYPELSPVTITLSVALGLTSIHDAIEDAIEDAVKNLKDDE